MRGRLEALIERLFDAADDDPLILSAGALLAVAALAALIGLGIAAGALLWIARPWSLLILPAGSLVLARWLTSDEPRG